MLDNYDVLLIKAVLWPFTLNLLHQVQVIAAPKAACVQCVTRTMMVNGFNATSARIGSTIYACVNLEEDASIGDIEWLCGSYC